MAVAFIFTIKDATQAQYDESIKKLGEAGAGSPKGRLYHVAGAEEGGWKVIDVWESKEDWENFLKGSLGKILQEVGMSQPQIDSFPVHNVIQG